MRRIIQLLSLVVSNSFFPAIWRRTIYQGYGKSICLPILNCHACPLAIFSCPIGSLQYFIITRSIPFYIIGIFGTVGIFLGRWTCGWICPFGLLQDLLHKVKGKKIMLRQGFIRFSYLIFLVLVLIVPFFTLQPSFCKICPQGTLQGGLPIAFGFLGEHLRSQILLSSFFYLKLGILIAVIVLSISIKRFFCRTICPIGVILGIFNRISLLKLRVDTSRCNRCGICKKPCPVEIEVYKNPNSSQCIRCMECKKVCPKEAISVMW